MCAYAPDLAVYSILKAESKCVHTLLTWLCIQILKAESECVHTLLLSTCNAYEHHVSLRAAAQENLWPS